MMKIKKSKMIVVTMMIAALSLFIAGCSSVPEAESSVDDVKFVPVELDMMKKRHGGTHLCLHR